MCENKQLTIVTPTYNRAPMLKNLYNSLLSQTSKEFIWLVIDDGSVDGTKKVVEGFIADGIIEIKYIYQKNSGKYVAHNVGATNCETELFLCVDSDDTLFPDAVEKINQVWKNLKSDKSIVGIVAPREMNGYAYMTNPPRTSRLMDLYNKGKLRGETSLVFRSETLKKYQFPIVSDETFMSEDILYNEIDQKYKYYVLNDFLCHSKYQDDGLTKNIEKIHWRNPNNTLIMYLSNAAYQENFIKAAKSYACYLAWKKTRNLSSTILDYKVPARVKLAGFFLESHYTKIFMMQNKEFNNK